MTLSLADLELQRSSLYFAKMISQARFLKISNVRSTFTGES